MEQFLKIICSKVTQISVFLLHRSSFKSFFFTFRSLNYHNSNPQLCKYFTWETMQYAWNIETF